jgi:hypothetical protein
MDSFAQDAGTQVTVDLCVVTNNGTGIGSLGGVVVRAR